MADTLSRRDLFRTGFAVAAGASASASALDSEAQPAQSTVAQTADAAAHDERSPALESLTAWEFELLEAIVARLIPSSPGSPGAREAHAAHYIDRALAGALATSRQAYAAGLSALDRYARSSRGQPFLDLPPRDQESVLIDCETGGATGFATSPAQFFALLLAHTRQGTFGDPYYGGNAGYVGWDLLRYPGMRTMVSASDQKALESGTLDVVRRSAYDSERFNKATARAGSPVEQHGH